MLSMNKKVLAALTANTIIKNLCGSRIKHNGQPDGGQYPSVYYGEISNVPALMADNLEKYSRITIQVSVLSDTGDFWEIPKEVETVMLGLGFARYSYTDTDWLSGSKQVFCKAMRFIIGGVNE